MFVQSKMISTYFYTFKVDFKPFELCVCVCVCVPPTETLRNLNLTQTQDKEVQ